jgi:hypothetical protein
MRPTFRRAAITALVVASLAPGLVQARPFNASSRLIPIELGRDGGLFSMVWSLLTDVVSGRVPGTGIVVSPRMAKDATDPGDNGGRMDPNGAAATSTPPDNGGRMDPNG